MSYTVEPIVESDYPAVAEMYIDSFWDAQNGQPDDIMMNALYPKIQTPEGRADAVKRLTGLHHAMQATPEKTLKAVDPKTSKACGYLFWAETDKVEKPNLDWLQRTWYEDDASYEKIRTILLSGHAMREDAMSKVSGPIVNIIDLAIAPTYQRKGVGSTLVQWVVNYATKKDATVILHAADNAVNFYQRLGFQIHVQGYTQMPEQSAHIPSTHYTFLIKPGPQAYEKKA